MYKDETCPVSSPNNLEVYIEQAMPKKYSLEVYNESGDLLGYRWAYGDNVTLKFNLKDYLEDMKPDNVSLEDFIKNKSLGLDIYDSRSNYITSVSSLAIDETYNSSLLITQALSEEFLSKCLPLNYYGSNVKLLSDNIYTCVMSLVSDDGSRIRFADTKLYLIDLYRKVSEVK